MSQWLDEKYVALVGMQLERFHKQSKTTFTFRCPICNDSVKNLRKTRGYFFFYPREQTYFFKCHNCNASMSLRTFLNRQAPELYREYMLDMLRQDRPVVIAGPTAAMVVERKQTLVSLPTIASLPADHPGKQYCVGRGLPEPALHHLHYTDEWTTWIKELGWSYALPEDHGQRLIIPWYDRRNGLLGAQARRIDATGSVARYVTLKDENVTDKIYGWDRVNLHQPIHVVEGPLDSWFLPNSVASMDSDLMRMHDKYFHDHSAIYIWDNEPRNAAVSKNIGVAVKMGLPVVIWPGWLKEKDLNDMSQAGHDVVALVRQNTYQGLRAELEYAQWKKL